MQKLHILFFIQVECSDNSYITPHPECGYTECPENPWIDKFNGTTTDCDDSELEKYFKDAQSWDPSIYEYSNVG